jgi:hypothetical protein
MAIDREFDERSAIWTAAAGHLERLQEFAQHDYVGAERDGVERVSDRAFKLATKERENLRDGIWRIWRAWDFADLTGEASGHYRIERGNITIEFDGTIETMRGGFAGSGKGAQMADSSISRDELLRTQGVVGNQMLRVESNTGCWFVSFDGVSFWQIGDKPTIGQADDLRVQVRRWAQSEAFMPYPRGVFDGMDIETIIAG